MDYKTSITGNPAIEPAGYIKTTSANMPVVMADKVAVEITGSTVLNRNFVSLETKIASYDNSLEVIAAALNAIANS